MRRTSDARFGLAFVRVVRIRTRSEARFDLKKIKIGQIKRATRDFTILQRIVDSENPDEKYVQGREAQRVVYEQKWRTVCIVRDRIRDSAHRSRAPLTLVARDGAGNRVQAGRSNRIQGHSTFTN